MSKILARRFASKTIFHGQEARQQMLRGCNVLADAVEVTMGPKGRNVVIEQMAGSAKLTKDGVTVAKAVDLQNKIENIGANLVKQVAVKANDEAGDGTTCATILARAIFSEGCKAVAAGMNPMDVKRGIDSSIPVILEELKKQSKEINTPEEIFQVATIASNSDHVIGSLIRDAMEKVGKDGTITVQDNRTHEHALEVEAGLSVDRGYISPWFITNSVTQKVEFDNPLILLCDKKISSLQPLLPSLEMALKANRPLLIVAEDVEGEALRTLCVNRVQGGSLQVAAIKAPGFGEQKKNLLQDIAVLVGGQVVSEEVGMQLEEMSMEKFGSARRIEVSKDSCLFLEGHGGETEIQNRCETLKNSLTLTNSEYEKDKLKERLGKLTGQVAVIKVGGRSDVEVQETKDRINDALCATYAAVEEGIVPGGGVALLYASRALDGLLKRTQNFDQQVGIKIVKKALEVPCSTIVKNSGKEGAVVIEHLLQQDDRELGYDAQLGEYRNMLTAGIVDPKKVVRTAIADAASVASLMCTSETCIVSDPEDKKNPSPY